MTLPFRRSSLVPEENLGKHQRGGRAIKKKVIGLNGGPGTARDRYPAHSRIAGKFAGHAYQADRGLQFSPTGRGRGSGRLGVQ